MKVEWLVEGENCWTIDGVPYCEWTMDKAEQPGDLKWTEDPKSAYKKGILTVTMRWRVKPHIEEWLVANNFRYMIETKGQFKVDLVFYDKAAALMLKLTWGGAQC